MFRDLLFGLRAGSRSPGFTLLAVVTLALGIGATTSVYSFVAGVLLSPLPYRDADALVLVSRRNEAQGFRGLLVPARDLAALRDQTGSFTALTGFSIDYVHVGGDLSPEHLRSATVLPELLPLLGLEPVLGRGFASEDEPSVVILSDGIWRRRFGADRDVVGRTLRIDGEPHAILGILAEREDLPFQEIDVLRLHPPTALALEPDAPQPFFRVVGRLRSGVSAGAAHDDVNAVLRRLEEENPPPVRGWGADVVPLKHAIVGDVEPALLVLLGAVGVVLLIACTNVANLLLARGLARESEMAVRAALGAGRARLVRQLLTESALLSLAGGLLGIGLAVAGTKVLIDWSPASVPRLSDVTLDRSVLVFALSLSVASGLLAGAVPALGISKHVLRAAASRATVSASWRRLRGSLTVSQIALALALVIAAGLLTRSFARLVAVDPGFEPLGAMSLRVALPDYRYPEAEGRNEAVAQILEHVGALPDVVSVAAASWTPLSGAWGRAQISAEESDGAVREREQWPVVLGVSPDFFRTLGFPMLRGRDFTPRDRFEGGGVVILSEALAAAAWPGEVAVRRRLKFGAPSSDNPWLTVVGVVADARLVGLQQEAEETMFLPFLGRAIGTFQMFVRSRQEPLDAVRSIRSVIGELDPEIPIASVHTMDEIVSGNSATPRFHLLVVALFAFVALVLAGSGIVGVVANGVVQREREIGVRVALGADRRAVLRLVVKQGMGLVALGVGVGLLLAALASRLLEAFLFDISTLDPGTFTTAALLLAIVGLAATVIPAWRATRIDPMVTLRTE